MDWSEGNFIKNILFCFEDMAQEEKREVERLEYGGFEYQITEFRFSVTGNTENLGSWSFLFLVFWRNQIPT